MSRRAGVPRWPYRKLVCYDKRITELEKSLELKKDERDISLIKQEILAVEKKKNDIYSNKWSDKEPFMESNSFSTFAIHSEENSASEGMSESPSPPTKSSSPTSPMDEKKSTANLDFQVEPFPELEKVQVLHDLLGRLTEQRMEELAINVGRNLLTKFEKFGVRSEPMEISQESKEEYVLAPIVQHERLSESPKRKSPRSEESPPTLFATLEAKRRRLEMDHLLTNEGEYHAS
jgi:hypothetical protein